MTLVSPVRELENSQCPVCGFDLGEPPWRGKSASDEICPSCGIQFGYDDWAEGDPAQRARVYWKWRNDWISAGRPWRSVARPPPANWDPIAQLNRVLSDERDR